MPAYWAIFNFGMDMNSFFGSILAIVMLIAAISCKNSCSNSKTSGQVQENTSQAWATDSTKVQPQYALGYNVKYSGNLKLVEISDPSGNSSKVYKFALAEEFGNDIPDGYTPIKIPVQSVICMTTLQLAGFITLEETST